MADDGAYPYHYDWGGSNTKPPPPESSTPHSRRRRPLERRRRRRRPVGCFTADSSSLPATDTSHPPGEPSHESFPWPTEQPGGAMGFGFSLEGRYLAPMTYDEFVRGGPRMAARSRASSSAAPRSSNHPEAERTGRGTRVRQSVLYAEPRRSRLREPTHSGLPQPLRGRSVSDSVAFPSDPPRAVEPVSRTQVRQSVLYSNRPRRPRQRQVPAPTQEHPSEVSSSELGKAATDLPTLEALSLSDSALFIPHTVEESDYDDVEDVPHEPVEFGIETLGPQTLRYLAPPPQSEWLGGVRGQTPLEELAPDVSYTELDPSTLEALTASDSDYDTEEELRLLDEYLAANTCTSIRQAFDEIITAEHDALTELAAKMGIEPPTPRQAKHLPVDHETQSLQAWQQPSSAAAQTQHSTAPRKPRCEASNTELVENAENWMREEVKMVFEKYIERRHDLKGLGCCFNELSHQCFNVENYNKIFHHYNFTVRMKESNSVDWVVAPYFAEVKQIFGRKSYFCCRLEPNENGTCYACKSQGVEDLQHPVTGGYERGLSNVGFGLWYE